MQSVLRLVWLWHSEQLQHVAWLSRTCSLNGTVFLLFSARLWQSPDGTLLGHPASYITAAPCRQL